MSSQKDFSNHGIFFSVISYLSHVSDSVYIALILGFASCVLLTGIITNFRLLVLLFMILWFFLWVKLKDLVLSSFLTTLFSLQFYAPNKYYIQEIIRGGDMLLPLYGGGYYLGYGANVANIFIVFTLAFLIKEVIQKQAFRSLLSYGIVSVVLVCATGFFITGFITSVSKSLFVALSVTWLIQYMQMFLLALLTLSIFLFKRKQFNVVYVVVLCSALFQFVLAGLQFLRQSPIGNPVEQIRGPGSFATGLDEINAIYRVAGSFAFHNQLALIMLIFFIILLPYILKKRYQPHLASLFFIFVTIILTQSRSVWIATGITVLLALRMLRKEIRNFSKRFYWPKIIIYFFVGLTSLSYVIIPRILLSFNAIYEGAGIPIRMRLLSEAFPLFLLRPWFGYGVGTNEYVMSSQNLNSVMFVFPTAAHLGILQLLLEVGLIGVLFFLFPFLYIFRGLVNAKTTHIHKPDLFGYTFRFIAGSTAFFLYYLFLPHVGIIEFAYLGIILGTGCIALTLVNEQKRA